ncbi:hypothetical protein PIB30_072292 [Stylosanthes scabra]|uniref:Uncharacterized protein n=1 Tax=Stylosanthes scabra TaxID=79078 RepID=A0ABU6TNP3_9FABA|nr:hypothetical protein [Stylosanthes scabra]
MHFKSNVGIQKRKTRATEAKKNPYIGNKRVAEAAEAVKNQRTVEAHERDENSSEDEEEDASELSTDKKGMSLDMYFMVHGINLDDEDNEEDEEDKRDEGRIGRARSSLVNLLKIMRLMVVLGCSKSRGAAFGVPLSVGIQVFGRASASRNLSLNGFESGFKEKDLKYVVIAVELQRIDSTCNIVDFLSHFLREMGFREQRIDSHDLRISSDFHRGQLIII